MDPPVRVASSLVLVGLLGAPAVACPLDGACLALAAAPAPTEVSAARPVRPTVRWAPRLAARDAEPVSGAVVFACGDQVGDPSAMWNDLRDQVYARMPRFDAVPQVTMVVSPVIVRSTFDTVPGFGLSGDF